MLSIRRLATVAIVAALMALALPGVARATHIGAHAVPCDAAATVGGGTLGVSPGPVGAPNSLGWDVGSGQCNGSFSVATDGAFPGGALELGLRVEQRRIGQVAQTGPNDYTVLTGADVGPPAAVNRAWWNFQGSIAYNGSIAGLDALMLEISTDVGPNLPAFPVVDLLALRPIIDDRNNQPNATVGFADLYQISQNPEFGWFAPTSDTDANPTGAFDYDAPGAWRFTLTAVEGAASTSLTVCIHTPGEECADPTLEAQKQEVRDSLVALLSTGDAKDDKRIEKAIEAIDKSLNPAYWVDGNTLDPEDGKKVFDRESKAVKELGKVEGTDVSGAIDALVAIDEALALGAIGAAWDAYFAAGCDVVLTKDCEKAAKELDKAAAEMAKAADEAADGDYDKAIDKYKKAWEKAQKALDALS